MGDVKKNLSEETVSLIENLPITRLFNQLKEKRRVSIAVEVDKETGEVTLARLRMGSVDYYFHKSVDDSGNFLEIEKREREGATFYDIPYDGWDVTLDDLSIFSKSSLSEKDIFS